MDKFPGVREMGEHIRTAMSRVLEVALLVGSVTAANAMAATVGSLFVVGFYLLNKQSKKPIVDLAVGPVAAILFGIILNILVLIPFGLGFCIGVVLLTKILDICMSKYPGITYLIILGFLIGSVFPIYPGNPVGWEIPLSIITFLFLYLNLYKK